MKRHSLWITPVLAALAFSGCSSKADRELAKELEEAKKRQAYYNSPEFKAKQREILDQQWKGSSEAMRNFRFPDAPPATPVRPPKDDRQHEE